MNPKRGEIWRVNAVVINSDTAGRLSLRLVVPLTGWNPNYASYFWMTRIDPAPANGLTKPSAADAFQMRGVDLGRFEENLGFLSEDILNRIAKAIALTVEFNPQQAR